MAEPFLAEYLAVEDSFKGVLTAGTRMPMLLFDPDTGDTILRPLVQDADILFQNADGTPLALSVSVAWVDILSKPTTIAGFGITDAYTETEVDTLLAAKSNVGHTHPWVDVSKTGSSLADLATRSAADLTGTLLDAQVAASNVTQHQAALSIATSQLTGTLADALVVASNVTQHQASLSIAVGQITGTLPFGNGGLGFTTIGKGEIVIGTATDTIGKLAVPATDGWVLTWDTTTGLPVWEAPTGGGGGLSNAFTAVDNSAGVEQFAASGADAIQFAAGADLSVAFDAVNKRVTFAYTGAGSGITRGYADINGDTGSIAAAGADTVTINGAAGISVTATSGTPDTLTITLGNHSAALLTTGTLQDSVVVASNVTQHQAALSIAATQLTGTIATGRISGSYTGITGVGTLAAGTWQATLIGTLYGGTGINASAAANGSLLIGNGSGFSLATITAGSNITITNSAGGITIASTGGSASFVGATAYASASTTIPTATWTNVAMASEIEDTDGFHSTVSNTQRFTVPTGKGGRYLLTAGAGISDGATGSRTMRVVLNIGGGGTEVLTRNETNPANTTNVTLAGTTQVTLSAGDTLDLQVYQNSGSDKTTSAFRGTTYMSLIFLGA